MEAGGQDRHAANPALDRVGGPPSLDSGEGVEPVAKPTVGYLVGRLDDQDIGSCVSVLTDGRLRVDHRYSHWGKLVGYCLAFAHEVAETEFDGRRTLAAIMDAGMKRLRAQHGLPAPKAWLPVMRKLREGGAASEAGRVIDLAQIEAAEAAEHESKAGRADSAYRFFQWPAQQHGIDISACRRLLEPVDFDVRTDWERAVAYLDSVPDLPAELARLRECLRERIAV